MVAEKRHVPIRNPVFPCPAACMMRNGLAMNAAISAMPWLMLFAISSARDCSRMGPASKMRMPVPFCYVLLTTP